MAGVRLQEERVKHMCISDVAQDLPAPMEVEGPAESRPNGVLPIANTVRSLTWSWDEAEQKVKRFRGRHSRLKAAADQSSQQTMVQAGAISKFTESSNLRQIGEEFDA